ncbi:hypothetical protein BH18VER1_BH18VER1_17140 [soil metagenome]
MEIPFLRFFKKSKAQQPALMPVAPLEKKSSERLSKTVMPNSARVVAPEPTAAFAQTPSAPEPAPTAAPLVPRTVGFNGGTTTATAIPRTATLPPAVALALEPNVERTIALELAEVVAQIPDGLVRPLEEGEATRQVLLRASELERGMANGKPTVSLTTIYEQVPEIFAREILPTDVPYVALPFSAVLEQFSKLQTRADQQRTAAVPQVQTPFLMAAVEDGERFGISTKGAEIEEMPTVRVQPATAHTLAEAEPEPAAVTPRKPFSLRPAAGTEPTSLATPPAAPTRIPFKLNSNGTDAPAPGSVPASSGPSVPASSPTPAAAPTRIPFKISAPSEDARPKPEPWVTKETLEAEAAAAAHVTPPHAPAGEVMISLSLRSILKTLPPLQLVGDIDAVESGTRVEFPFSLVAPQLVSGRVTIDPEQFAAVLPANYTGLFNAEDRSVPVSLPLQEVLKNLPATSLQMRDDQEEQEKGANFDTPFAAKAAEDAKRFKIPATAVPKPSADAPAHAPVVSAPVIPASVIHAPVIATPEAVMSTPEPAPAVIAKADAAPKAEEPTPEKSPTPNELPAPATVPASAGGRVVKLPGDAPAPGGRNALQNALDTDDTLDAKAVVAHIGKMDGIEACAIMFGDGLSLAGNMPESYETEGLCAMAPSLLQRVENHMVETQLGALRAMTLSCAKAAITFFMHDNLCLAALHAKDELAADIRDRLGRAVQELSRQYSQPA